jgi:signal peptidase I
MPSRVGWVFIFSAGMLALCIVAVVHAPYVHRQHNDKPSLWWLALLVPLAVGAAAGHANWVYRSAGFSVFSMPSQSMENTIPENSRVMIDRWYYDQRIPARGDIVVYQNVEGFYLMKRLIATSGETIEGRNGVIFINGERITEPYVIHSSSAGSQPDVDNFGPLKILPGKLFVMGDNRDISLDSRSSEIGPIDMANLRGRALYVLGGLQQEYKNLE